MRTQVTLQPGQKGTKKPLAQYSNRLVCTLLLRRNPPTAAQNRRVDRRGDAVASRTPGKQGRRGSRSPCRFSGSVLAASGETGGRWNPTRRVWELRRDQALKLGLKERIERAKVSISRHLGLQSN